MRRRPREDEDIEVEIAIGHREGLFDRRRDVGLAAALSRRCRVGCIAPARRNLALPEKTEGDEQGYAQNGLSNSHGVHGICLTSSPVD
jgi:hypothetical protein